jgi:hypothetical protein
MESVKFNLESVLVELEEVSYDSLQELFKEKHNNKLFVKKVDEAGSLLMIYNNLDTAKDNKLYQECRSIVYDVQEKRIVSYSHDNVRYAKLEDYEYKEGDVLEQSFEGTMIGVYHHGDKWYFSSTRCPDVNKSYYFNKKKSHGEMFDETLKECFPNVEDVRGELVKHLDVTKVYYFVLVHHENKYLVDYTSQFGKDYKFLVHIITRDKETQSEVMNENELKDIKYVFYPKKFSTYKEACEYLNSSSKLDMDTNMAEGSEGIIVKSHDKESNKHDLMKIPTCAYTILRYERPNNLNVWVNCIEIFQRNNKNYTADAYLKKYTKEEMKDMFNNGKHLDVTGVLCAIFKGLALGIMNLYNHFTKYDKSEGRYEKINGEDYKVFNENKNMRVMKVTLNRLQNFQYRFLKDNYTMSNVIDHLRYHTTPEDIMELIKIHDSLKKEENLFKIMTSNITNKDTIDRFMRTFIFYYEHP